MDSIPVMGTAIVNGVHWLKRLISSVDFPVDTFIIFNNNGRGQITKDLDELQQRHNYIKNIVVCHLPVNIGCPAAWNMIIKCYIQSRYWLIVNHDISFTSGFLEKMHSLAQSATIGMVHGASGEFGLGTWDVFLIKDWVVDKYGLFDENLYPAYCEDWDYLLRFVHNPINKAFVDLPYYHGETLEYAKSGSQTWREDMSLKYKIDSARYLNESNYLVQKWGLQWNSLNPHKTPFNNKDSYLGYSKYDINFIRHKYIGF